LALKIVPSILSASQGNLTATVKRLYAAGLTTIHLDIMDGCFVPEITFGAKLCADLGKEVSATWDAHLMVANPEHQLERFVEAGADWITVHYESSNHIHRLLSRIKELGKLAGVSINPGTPVTALEPLLDVADLILVMTVNPGWGGQKLITSCLDKVRWLRERTAAKLMVDGGVNLETIGQVADAGADLTVVGSALFRGELDEVLPKLQQAAAHSSKESR